MVLTRPTAPRTLAAGPSTALVESTPKNTPEDVEDALDEEDIPMTLTPAQLKALLRENMKEAIDVVKQQLVSGENPIGIGSRTRMKTEKIAAPNKFDGEQKKV